ADIEVPDRSQLAIQVVNKWNSGRDVHAYDLFVGHVVEVLDQRTQTVAVRRHQNSPSFSYRRGDHRVPVGQETLDSVFQTFGQGNLIGSEGLVSRIDSGVARVVGLERGRADVVASPPDFCLFDSVSLGGLGLVQALQSSVVSFVQTPVVDDRN